MSDDPRLLQVFLSPHGRGVFEISADECGRLHCNCPGFRARHTCKHYAFVADRLRANDGEYTIGVPCDLAEQLTLDSLRSPEGYRDFVLRYGTVEVL